MFFIYVQLKSGKVNKSSPSQKTKISLGISPIEQFYKQCFRQQNKKNPYE